ncbi:NAD(P)H-dependent oxidoreductase [Rosenbergiella collisarenosi]|uniref:NAD(P)H-dependent oxidoreductase n=1 Tax=Rosenbergiella collisarenosi TaxID=1544695 RepID=UPI001F4FF15F|nr:NAD(P)H-dependent oxidoreductase [Rosenbergiella collisarenosi]
MKILLVYAQPESSSLTNHLVREAEKFLSQKKHSISHSDLYAMDWKAVMDESDFTNRKNQSRLSFIQESGHAYCTKTLTKDIQAEHEKLNNADAVIFIFPLWWYSMPAIMKGWIDRVWTYGLAYGYKNAGNRYRYGEGAFLGKRALLAINIGGPELEYSQRGINGKLDDILFPITHGTLFYTGMTVLPTFAIYNSVNITEEQLCYATAQWIRRLDNLFSEPPIPFRRQNGGDYPDHHLLDESIMTGVAGLDIHIEK